MKCSFSITMDMDPIQDTMTLDMNSVQDMITDQFNKALESNKDLIIKSISDAIVSGINTKVRDYIDDELNVSDFMDFVFEDSDVRERIVRMILSGLKLPNPDF